MGVEFKETPLPLPSKDNEKRFSNKKLVHICEVCEKRDVLTPEEGYDVFGTMKTKHSGT